MTLPSHERCQQIVKDLKDDPALSEWEYEFLNNNITRTFFSARMKEIFAKLEDKYEI